MVWSLILSFCVISCGTVDEKETKWKYDVETEDLERYVEEFERLSVGRNEKHVTALVVKFADLEDPVTGLCELYTKQSPVISIDRSYWAGADDAERENLMFHELGHCVLRRGHLETRKDLKPVSIMFPSLIPFHYKGDRVGYVNELFSIEGDWFRLRDEDVTFICGENHGI